MIDTMKIDWTCPNCQEKQEIHVTMLDLNRGTTAVCICGKKSRLDFSVTVETRAAPISESNVTPISARSRQ